MIAEAFASIAATVARGAALVQSLRTPKPNPAWVAATDRLAGKLVPPTRWRGPMLAAVVDGLAVAIDTYTDSNGETGQTFTRARVAVDAPGFSLRFWREGMFAAIGKALGAQGIEIGDAAFDADLVVRSNRPNLARAWLCSAARGAVRRQRDFTFFIEDGTATVRSGRYLRDAEALVALAHAAAYFAGGGRALKARWAEAAGELGGTLVAPFAVELLEPAGLVHITADATHEHTKVTLARVGGAPVETTIDAIEPDAAAWRAAIAALTADRGGAVEGPYR